MMRLSGIVDSLPAPAVVLSPDTRPPAGHLAKKLRAVDKAAGRFAGPLAA
jgi:hypothetical protein